MEGGALKYQTKAAIAPRGSSTYFSMTCDAFRHLIRLRLDSVVLRSAEHAVTMTVW